MYAVFWLNTAYRRCNRPNSQGVSDEICWSHFLLFPVMPILMCRGTYRAQFLPLGALFCIQDHHKTWAELCTIPPLLFPALAPHLVHLLLSLGVVGPLHFIC